MDFKKFVLAGSLVVSLLLPVVPALGQVPCASFLHSPLSIRYSDDCPGPRPPGQHHMSFYTFNDLDGDGAPAGDEGPVAYVHIVLIDSDQTWTTDTDANGGATIPGLPPGRYSVRWDGQEWDVDLGDFNLLILLPVKPRVVYLPMITWEK